MAKQMRFDAEARDALRRGFDQLADAVRLTLGPRGRNVVLDRAGGTPAITNDGVTIAREIELADPFENLGAQLGREISAKTQDVVGDGTTTATVLAQSMVRHGFRVVAAGANPMTVKRGMDRAAHAVVQDLRGRAKPVRTTEEIARVATLAAGQDAVVGDLVARGLERVGRDGVITVEEGRGLEPELEAVEGMRFDRGYISPYFITDPEQMNAVLENPWILLVDGKVADLAPVLPLLEDVSGTARPVLVVAEDVEGEALSALVVNCLRGTLSVAAVKAPGYGDRRRALLEDLAVVVGAQVIGEQTGRSLERAGVKDLGSARRVVVDRDACTVVGGGGRAAAIRRRVDAVRAEKEAASSDYDREQLGERLGRLTGGVAVLRVGAHTEIALRERKARVDDALAATRAAVEEGVVPGGGVALLRAEAAVDALKLPGEETLGARVIREALSAPLRQIAENAGWNGGTVVDRVRDLGGARGFNAVTGDYEDLARAGVIDPAKVLRSALQSAVSIAGLILTTQTLVADVPDPDPGPGDAAED